MNSDFEKRKVVIYARVSTEHEAQKSALENQLDWYKPIMDMRPNWELVEWYVDEGITGTSAQKRPQFLKMIEDAKKRKFDLILTREVSRFARNTVDTLQYTRLLKEYGVEVFFLNDNIKTFDGDGELRLTIMATLAQDESRKTSVRVKAGQQTSMENGVIYGNGNILGYDKVGKEMIINPEQAETVRMIYDMYLDGMGIDKIKKELEKRGRKTAMGNLIWHCTVISHILNNSFYCGIIVYHKQYTPDYLKQKKFKNYGEVEQTKIKGTHETIVTEEEFERVQKILEGRRRECKNLPFGKAYTWKNKKTNMWSKLLVCSCGHTFSRKLWNIKAEGKFRHGYKCYGQVQTGSYAYREKNGLPLDGICKTKMVPEWKLYLMANKIFKNYLTDKEKVLEIANSILESHIDDKDKKEDNGAIIKRKEAELQKLLKRKERYVEMRADGEISREMFLAKSKELDDRRETLQEELEELNKLGENAVKVTNYREKLDFLEYALSQYLNLDDVEDVPDYIIEAFVEKIVVKEDGFDWYLRFNGDTDKPIHCTATGRGQKNCKVGVNSPTFGGHSLSQSTCHTGSN